MFHRRRLLRAVLDRRASRGDPRPQGEIAGAPDDRHQLQARLAPPARGTWQRSSPSKGAQCCSVAWVAMRWWVKKHGHISSGGEVPTAAVASSSTTDSEAVEGLPPPSLELSIRGVCKSGGRRGPLMSRDLYCPGLTYCRCRRIWVAPGKASRQGHFNPCCQIDQNKIHIDKSPGTLNMCSSDEECEEVLDNGASHFRCDASFAK